MLTEENTLSASDLFAISQGRQNEGDNQCHWCYSRCGRQWTHDDAAPIPFVRSVSTAKNPSGLFVCLGCWLWQRKRVTVQRLDGSWQDGQTANKHSWWITTEGAWVLSPLTVLQLWDQILNPPRRFILSIIDEKVPVLNHLQLALINDVKTEIKATTPLVFTLNGIKHSYTTYELEEASSTQDANGTEPGVQALVRLLGFPLPPKNGSRRVGRPGKEDMPKTRHNKTVRVSGG